MTEVENQTLNLLKNIIENRDKIFESINEAKEKLIPIVNIINILGNTYYEVSNSSLLYNILKTSMEKYKGHVTSGELGLPITDNNLVLPCGIYGRWECD